MERKLKLVDQIIEHALLEEPTNIPLIDNVIADAKGESRMWTEAEKSEVLKTTKKVA